MISGDLRRSGGVDLREGVESSVPQDDALLNSTPTPASTWETRGHPSMLPATKRWGRRLEGPLAEVARTASAFLARSAEGEAPSYGFQRCSTLPLFTAEMATRPYARPRPHLLCFNVLPWSQRASRHDSIAPTRPLPGDVHGSELIPIKTRYQCSLSL